MVNLFTNINIFTEITKEYLPVLVIIVMKIIYSVRVS